MSVFVLDTDTLTLVIRGNELVCRRVLQLAADQLAVSIITVEESLTGWYTQIRRARRDNDLLRAYQSRRWTFFETFVYLGLTPKHLRHITSFEKFIARQALTNCVSLPSF